jgi:spore coat protein CotH
VTTRGAALAGMLATIVLSCAATTPAAAQTPPAAPTSDDFFDAHGLNRVDLLVNSRDWARLRERFTDNTYYPADLHWRGVTVRNIGIRSRGNGSRSRQKPGLRVDVNRYAPLQDFLGLKSFVLDNLAQDPSGMREWAAMRLYERLGFAAPRVAHVQLYVNNTYAGLYTVVESIDKDFLRRVFGANATGVENDGYLFDFEWVSEWRFTYLGPDLAAWAERFDPVTHARAPAGELYQPIDDMFRAINDARDDRFVEAVEPYLDLERFVRFVAAQAFMAEWDGLLGYAGANNFYLYRFEDSLRSQFIPWDADNAFHALDYPLDAGHRDNVLMRRAMQVPELRDAFADGVRRAARAADRWLEREIGDQWDRIAGSMVADGLKPFTNEAARAAVADLRLFARERPSLTSPADPAAAGSARPAAAFPSRPR